MLKSLILISSLTLSGCCVFGKGTFEIPEREPLQKLHWIKQDDLRCLDFENRKVYLKNEVETDGYIDMLKIIIDGCNEVIK